MRTTPRGSAVRAVKLGTTAVCVLGFVVLSQTAWYEALRERVFDSLLASLVGRPATGAIVVVDIDRAALQEFGSWPWSHERLAELVRSIAGAKPAVLGLDMLLSERDDSGSSAGNPAPAGMHVAAAADDHDTALAAALGQAPSILGVVLDPERNRSLPGATPVFVQPPFDATDFWRAPGVISPGPRLAGSATGMGVIALAGDRDGAVRRVPLLASVGDQLLPGLAVEILRVGDGASVLFVEGSTSVIKAGSHRAHFGASGSLRLVPTDPQAWPHRTVSALSLLRDANAASRLSGKAVLLGSSAPEAGGLRTASQGLLVPSVQLQADATEQLVAGSWPDRSQALANIELTLTVALGVAAAWCALSLAPQIAGVLVSGAGLAWLIAALASLRLADLLVDPILVPVAIGVCFGANSLVAFAETLHREALIKRRFEQHLAPEIVRRIVDNPCLLKLEGELREVTSMFTDIESFTTMTERAEPRALVSALDHYFDGLTRVIVDHGGMIDKITGDGIHALFNAPIDLADHPTRALLCAREIIALADAYRATAEGAALGFGQTRIGIETGPAIVGDVGGGRRVVYTAHGNAINTASRLEAANKELGSVICVGPTAASRVAAHLLRPLGNITVRGRSQRLSVFDLWPDGFTDADRSDYLQLLDDAATAPLKAIQKIEQLMLRWPEDHVLRRLVERMKTSPSDLSSCRSR